MVFADRVEAGKKLAMELAGTCKQNGVVLAIPRGGVVVGAEIARILGMTLDVIIPRKIGAPHNPEVAIGAVTQDGITFFNKPLLNFLELEEKDLARMVEREKREIERRMLLYRGQMEYPDYSGRCIIVVDDGIATGYTVKAALRWIRQKFKPQKLILAVPVAPQDTLDRLEDEVDQLVVLETPDDFYAVGQFYLDFSQTTDQEVIQILKERTAQQA
ncbi:phosphoribosyltransferase [Desulfofundulus thermosubterraneus]|uniref:Predicted phosphoribosyltransferase n=1 Tax=Desulfofundulus thermosubterraneus DSM 16057 TaxID=1121432 RepID=A0A1M6D3D6_9FIRM|nr:phosphoribosyltransferase [Desulfofundulus thermosubterraneus]SHI67508.1 Predicted phosphoribosyltransferase [Desulfofundulus thermosubterraneus DSM 16057]